LQPAIQTTLNASSSFALDASQKSTLPLPHGTSPKLGSFSLPTSKSQPASDQGIIRTYPVVYHSLDTLLFASIDAPSIEIAHDWLEMITASCVMFNP
jgi:hypothetical protein